MATEELLKQLSDEHEKLIESAFSSMIDKTYSTINHTAIIPTYSNEKESKYAVRLI